MGPKQRDRNNGAETEDDILITEEENTNLSRCVPGENTDIEQPMG